MPGPCFLLLAYITSVEISMALIMIYMMMHDIDMILIVIVIRDIPNVIT